MTRLTVNQPSALESATLEQDLYAPDTTAVRRCEVPVGVSPPRVVWHYAVSILLIHLLSLLAVLPWFFSWTGVILAISGHFVFGMLGMTLGFHRLLTHQGFTCPKWFERSLAVLGVCCLQDTPARWVAVHRRHHQYSDETRDPHTPLVNLLWGHLVWLLWKNRETTQMAFYEQYAKDVLKDPFYRMLERRLMWFWLYVFHAVIFFAVGLAVGWISSGRSLSGVRFGSSLLVWGVFVRTVLVWHITWSVNSFTHIWGYRNYSTRDNSRNNWIVGLLAHGEGWHNNHHAEQRSARHGHKWWEFDMTWYVICFLELIGLAKNVVRPHFEVDREEPVGAA